MKALATALLAAVALAAQADPGRPQLDDETAARHRVQDYLDQGPSPWRPQPLTALGEQVADLVVAADGSGSHRTLQAAIDALPAAAPGARRSVVRLRPGTYRETVCARGKAPFALVGDAGDNSAVRIVAGRWNAQPRSGVPSPCDLTPQAATWGTADSASVAIVGDDVQLAHLTIANDALDAVRDGQGYPAGAGESGGAQAVALRVQGDRIQLHDVRLLGHQDTFMAHAPAPAAAARVLVQHSVVAGDVDFIFGDATLVLQHSRIVSRGGRRTPGHGGHVLAPSTAAAQRLGFLVTQCRFVAEPGLAAGAISLGRAWDFGVPRGQWQAGVSPNGQALVRDSVLGGHIGPWAASTSRRPFGPDHRLAEHRNTRRVHGPHREVMPVDDGWAAAAGGTWGGVDAEEAAVHTVRSRAELLAALAGPARPRIVQVAGRIDLAVDDGGQPLDAAAWRDPGFDETAFVQAYDPATWGRDDPVGALEDARRRSQQRWAAQVLVRLPSNTTLIGLGSDAGLQRGGLLLDGVDNVIVRNLQLSDAFDPFPAWEPRDNGHGEWNALLDNIGLRRATHVWIDHNTLDDGEPRAAAQALGRPRVHHDGLLDITHRSDLVTVSWNHLRGHDKSVLIGGSDRHADDAGALRVTLHHNRFSDLKERAPRVRFGAVQLVNNLYEVRADGPWPLGYSIGVGLGARLLSEHNAWVSDGRVPAQRLLRVFKGTRFSDQGSLLDGQPVALVQAQRDAGQPLDDTPSWAPTRGPVAEPASQVAARVRSGAGAGRLPAALATANR